MADSTNAERPGYTQSEKIVGQTFDDEFRYAKNRIIVATFSSNAVSYTHLDVYKRQARMQGSVEK